LPSLALVFYFAIFAFFAGCSSAPKGPVEVVVDRNTAATQLNLANSTAGRGHFEEALLILEEAWRLAVSTDDTPLRIKTTTSRGSFLFSLGREEEAFQAWEKASAEGDDSGESALAALARIYAIRARIILLSKEASEGGGNAAEAAEDYKAQLSRELSRVS